MKTRSLTLVFGLELEDVDAAGKHVRAVWSYPRIEDDEISDEVSDGESVELLTCDERELHVSVSGDERVIDEVFREGASSDFGSVFNHWFRSDGPWDLDSREVVKILSRMVSETRDYVENPHRYGALDARE